MMILRPDDSFAGCRIIALCGSGGTGVVYLAQDAMERQVALKIVAMCDARRELEGIRRYSRIAEGNPNLIRIYHAGIEKDFFYYIMEAADNAGMPGGPYIPKTLAAVLSMQGRLSAGESLKLIHDISTGLTALHESALVHRDIKPENIIFVRGVPKLCDPGLVSSTQVTGSLVGTLGYLPHECFDGQNLNTPGRDIYALGKVLYVAVTGESPANYPRMPQDLPLSLRRRLFPLLIRACDSNPKHRFETIHDFCSAMPEELPNPGKWERVLESFRQWRLVHTWFVPLTISVLLLLAIGTACGSLYFLHRQRKHLEYLHECREQCALEEKRFREKESMLLDQLFAFGKEKTAKELQTFLREPPADPAEQLRLYRDFDARLKKIARGRVLPVPEKAARQEIFRISDADRSLLASPLGGWLEPETRRRISARLVKIERQVFLSPKIQPGKDFVPLGGGQRRKFVYVPAGSFRNKKGELIEVRRQFWCSDGEERSDDFSAGLRNHILTTQPDMPMVQFVWNDLLEYCHLLTLFYRDKGLLPEGYIVRPLSTHEWQWACRGAWAGPGKATALLKGNSGGKAHPIRSGEPNSLGIYDMLGNVSEMTVPVSAARQAHQVDICGPSYKQKIADPEYRHSYSKYQFLPLEIGARVALAPGNMEFFERELWITSSRHAEFGGRHYELLVSNQTLPQLSQAQNLCRLLGGHLLTPDSPAQLAALNSAFPETRTYPVFIDGFVKNGVWLRPDGSRYTGIPMPGIPKYPSWCLTFHRGKVEVLASVKAPGVICQWSEAEYRNRIDPARIRKSPGVLHSFEIGNTLYVLFQYRAHNHTARQIAALLGGRLAEPRTPAIRKKFQEELAPWKDIPIMLGGVWKYGKWVFQDGSVLDMKLTLRIRYFLESRNPAAPGLLNGEFGNLQQSYALLLEIPLNGKK